MTQSVDYNMILAQGSKAKAKRSPIILLYGEKKIGKTTFAASFPKPAFLCGEDGAHSIADFRFPNEGMIESWEQLLTYARAMAYGNHDFKSLVLDTVGPLSGLCLDRAVKASNKGSWEKMGWGKEEDLVAQWRVLVSLLEHCRNRRNMNIVLVAHAIQQGVQDSQHGEKYYQWQGDMHRGIWAQSSNWVDILLYAAKERAIHEPENGHTRAIVKGPHWIYTQVTAIDSGFEAGVRGGYRLPSKMLLSYDIFNSELNETPDGVRARIKVLASQFGGEVATKTEQFMKEAGDNITDLKVIEKKLTEMKK